MEKKTLSVDQDTKILVPAKEYNLSEDKRLLIPFTEWNKIGFINRKGEIVVEPKYSMYHGECYSEEDYIKVSEVYSRGFPRSGGKVSTYNDFAYGLIDSKGNVILESNYRVLLTPIESKKLFTVQGKDYRYRVINANGEEVIPAGKYDWIDGFDHGFARVKIGKQSNNLRNNDNKWGIIDEEGNEVVPCSYSEIWNFYGKNHDTIRCKKDNTVEYIPFESLKKKHTEQQEIINDDYYEEDYGTHYGEYEGSWAQDVEGFSDDVINDAFDGDPDAYWNID